MNFIRRILATSAKEELVVLPSGQLFLTRSPNSPKGVNECIFKDAVASVRRTSTEFHYQLVVQRVYEEGEEGLEEQDTDDIVVVEENKDEWTFLIDEALRISYYSRDNHVIVSWHDLDGEPGDVFEFICDKSIKPNVFDLFDLTARKCQYERKYQKPFEGDADSDLDEFDFDPEQSADAAQTTINAAQASSPSPPAKKGSSSPPAKKEEPSTARVAPETPKKQITGFIDTEVPLYEGEVTLTLKASVHLFDGATGVFIQQAENATVNIIDMGGYLYSLEVSSPSKKLLGVLVNSEMNPCFNFEHNSFIFNYFSQSHAFSWLLKFETFELLEEFQAELMKALWEVTNKQKWVKVSENERDYIAESFQNMELDDIEEGEYEEEQEEEEEEEEKPKQDEEYDYDEGEDEMAKFSAKGKNSLLAVGTKNDRSYVLRGDKIGVFKHTAHDDLEFSTTIDNVATSEGRSFSPKKVMLHSGDQTMVLQDPSEQGKLFNMDLEYGKVIDEWKIGNDLSVKNFGPSSKFAQLSNEKTLIGLSENGLFRIDPRLSGSKLVESEHKMYATRTNKFNVLSTTEKGHIAVASMDGAIRLFDRIGINAKTHLPAIGDPIIGIDVSADGKWVLATSRTYLLLIDAVVKEGKNAGASGFLKSFGKDSKPRPMRLQITPEHVAYMQAETGKPLNFTQAHFNTGVDAKEQTIVSSSGPYVITWSLKKLLRGDREPYLIKRYSSQVTADNFKFGTDKNVIVALEDDVGMVKRSTFRKPTRESLATPARRVQAMSRNSIVNSPF